MKKKIFEEIELERNRQDDRWGVGAKVPYVWTSILAKKLGDVNAEVLKDPDLEMLKDYKKELTQLAAVCVAALEDIEKYSDCY